MKMFQARVGLFAICFCVLFSATAFAVDTDGDGVHESYPNPSVFNFPSTPSFTCDAPVTTGGGACVAGPGGGDGSCLKLEANSATAATPGCRTTLVTGNTVSFKTYRDSQQYSFNFYIDGQLKITSSAQNYGTWRGHSTTTTAGSHVLEWRLDVQGFMNSQTIVNVDDLNLNLPAVDNCPTISNTNQLNTDGDAQGDACDTDDDNDGLPDVSDNCPLNANADQLNTDVDAQGNVCDTDDDNDGVDDSVDAFPIDPAAAVDTDGDGMPDSLLLAQFEGFENTGGTGYYRLPFGWISGDINYYGTINSSGLGPHSGSRWLQILGDYGGARAWVQSSSAVTGSYVSFWYRTSTSSDSCFWFDIDGVRQTTPVRSSSWAYYSKNVTPGSHTLRWTSPCSGPSYFPIYIEIDDVDFGNPISSLILDSDDDNDGMSDTWEATYGLNQLVNDANGDADGDADGDGFTNLQEYNNGSNPTIARTKNDYTSDGIAGWIWKGQSNGVETQSQIWQLTFPLLSPNYGVPNRFYPPPFPDQANWELLTSGDFNKDGDADILWRHNTLATWKVWQMQNGTRVAQNAPADFDLAHEWQVIGAGDTDKDGDDDIILNNTTTGEVLIWQMQDHAIAATYNIGTKADYAVNRIGDFNKDGDVDLLFREIGSDVLVTWELQANAFVAERALANTGTDYSPVCAGDFDNDNDDDIMLVNSSTTQEKWFVMENYARTQTFGASNNGFVFKGCGDYDGDGDADSLWQRSSDDANRVVLQQNNGASKQTVYTNAFGGVNPGAVGYGFVYRGNSN